MALQRVCDIHDGEHEAVERTMKIDGETILVDACDRFVEDIRNRGRLPQLAAPSPNGKVVPAKAAVPAKKQVAAKRSAPKKLSRKAPAAKPNAEMRSTDATFPCFLCPKELESGSGFQSHSDVHGFATAGEMTGDKCPLCKTKHGRLTNHAKEEHGIPNAAQLFKAAVEAGDTHGIVAARRKVATNVS